MTAARNKAKTRARVPVAHGDPWTMPYGDQGVHHLLDSIDAAAASDPRPEVQALLRQIQESVEMLRSELQHWKSGSHADVANAVVHAVFLGMDLWQYTLGPILGAHGERELTKLETLVAEMDDSTAIAKDGLRKTGRDVARGRAVVAGARKGGTAPKRQKDPSPAVVTAALRATHADKPKWTLTRVRKKVAKDLGVSITTIINRVPKALW